MLFRRLIMNAIGVGVLAGLVMSFMQILTVNPVLLAAESFEQSSAAEQSYPASVTAAKDQAAVQEHAADGHHHSTDAWGPEEGAERNLFTLLSNVMAGIGFAALVLAVMSQLQLLGIAKISVTKGLAWGVAGFLAFFLAPGIGMPPEIPGAQSASVASRQTWWAIVVVCVSIGLLVLAYAPVKWKVLGLVSIVFPYLINIPHTEGPVFSHPDPSTVESLLALHQQFFLVSGISNFVFWIVLGTFCGWVLNRWVLTNTVQPLPEAV